MALTQIDRGLDPCAKGCRGTEEAGTVGRPCEDTGQRQRDMRQGQDWDSTALGLEHPCDTLTPGSAPLDLGGSDFQGSPEECTPFGPASFSSSEATACSLSREGQDGPVCHTTHHQRSHHKPGHRAARVKLLGLASGSLPQGAASTAWGPCSLTLS